MKKKLISVISLLLALSMLLCACASKTTTETKTEEPAATETTAAEETKTEESTDAAETEESADKQYTVALLTNKAGSSGFVDEAIAGGDRAREELGVTVDLVECEDNNAYETNLRFLSEDGTYDLIIIVDSTAADIVALVADDFPDQKFTCVDCKQENYANVRSVSAVNGEQAFLSGVLCGLITSGEYKDTFPMTNDDLKLCYAGGMDSPTSREGAAGFMAGAKYINPDIEILYTIVGGYADPATAKEITLLGADKGADVATGNCGSGIKGILEACKERNIYYIATSPSDNDIDQSLCCSVKKTDVMVYNEIKNLIEGGWTAGHNTFGIAQGVCDISFEGTAYENGIPEEIMNVIDDVRQQVVDGKITMPADVSDVDAWAAENQYYNN